MRLLLHLVAKDLRRKARAPFAFVAALSFPILFAGMIALAFGGGGKLPKVRLLVANLDEGVVGSAVVSAFGSPRTAGMFETTRVTEAEGRERMERGRASAFLTIPKGFTRDLLDGRPVTLRLVRNPSEGILPEIAAQTAGGLADLLEGARRVLSAPLLRLRPYLEDGIDSAPADADVVAIALEATHAIGGASSLIFPPVITLRSELFGGTEPAAEDKGGTGSQIFLLVLPGVAVYALFLVAENAMRDVLTERTLGTLRRQLAGPLTPGTYIVAKALYTCVLATAAIAVVSLVGWTVLTRPVSLPGFVLVSMALVLAVAGTAAAIYGLAGSERAGATLAGAIFLAMGFLGGGFFRIESLPPGIRSVAPFTPLYWGTQGYRALLEHGATLSGVARYAGVLIAMGVALLGVGMAALHRSARAGTAA
ncbi:MAG TPA: ABC transporter permease [Candidatus Polarisedimenticolaceae bacterium]|nr:ABC transporter permease [Candidatus Polarisedimenticolaceae bacterium]